MSVSARDESKFVVRGAECDRPLRAKVYKTHTCIHISSYISGVVRYLQHKGGRYRGKLTDCRILALSSLYVAGGCCAWSQLSILTQQQGLCPNMGYACNPRVINRM